MITQLLQWEEYQTATGNPWNAGNIKRWAAKRRIARLEAGNVDPVYAVVVRTDQCYGGPEEGGWYYDRHEILGVKRAWGFRDLLAVVRALRDGYPKSRYGRTSCAGGYDLRIYLVRDLDSIEGLDNTNQGRPRYE